MPDISTVSQHDWSLHRKGPIDQERHKQKIKEAIKKNLADIVSEESIILSDGKSVVKVPIRSLDEYRFRYDSSKQQHAGQGDGESKVGDVVAREPRPGRGRRGEAGEEPGTDYYEAEVTVDELAALIFEDLGLPYLEEKKLAEMESEAVRFTDVRKAGPLSNLDKRRTILENLKRNAAKGDPHFGDIQERRPALQDLGADDQVPVERRRHRHDGCLRLDGRVREVHRAQLLLLDGALPAHEVRQRQDRLHQPPHRGEGGHRGGVLHPRRERRHAGLVGLRAGAADHQERYNPEDWNIYPFHFSDGDNLPWDNERCVALVEQLMRLCNIFGYGEIREGHYRSSSTLMSAFNKIEDPKFIAVTISDRAEVYPALRRFFATRDMEPATP